jgi:glycosyltransferase 2 family protein
VLSGLALALWIVVHVGPAAIFSAMEHIHWWQFALICFAYPLVLVADTIGWHFSFPRGSAPFTQLLLARAAGEALNAASALAPVGGEPLRAWLVRPWVPYEESVPSIIVAKTANTTAQVLFLGLALAVALMTLDLGRPILLGMAGLLAFEVLAIAAFVVTQVKGGMSGLGRLLQRFGMARGAKSATRMDQMLSSYYARHRARLLASLLFHFTGRLLGAVEVMVILWSLLIPVTPLVALTIEAIGSGVRFATFFLPGSLGALEGANAAAFEALSLGAGAGLAFTLLRRARQALWIGLGLAAIALARLRVPDGAVWSPPVA